MEVTKCAEALRCQRAALGGSASRQAGTRVNAICAVAHMAFTAGKVRIDDDASEPGACKAEVDKRRRLTRRQA